MVYLILLGFIFFVQLLSSSWYDIAEKTGSKKKAFKYKMICSGICTAAVLLCAAISNSFTDTYTLVLIISFFLLFISDIVESKEGKTFNLLFTLLRFLALTVASVNLAIKAKSLFSTSDAGVKLNLAVAAICFICGAILYAVKKSRIPCLLASAYLLANSVLTGVLLQQSGNPQMQAASCAVIMGGFFIALSHIIFAFDKENKKSLYRINFYYFGLMFIACSAAVL